MRKEKLVHIVTFRLAYEHWAKLELAAHDAAATPNDWVRDLTIETLTDGRGLQPNQRILFEQFVRTQYLIANGFQLMADNKLTSEEWRKIRASAKEKINVIAKRALDDFRSRRSDEAHSWTRTSSSEPNT